MSPRVALLAALLLLAGCAYEAKPVDWGYWPANGWGNQVIFEDPDWGAVNWANYVFTYPARVRGNAVAGARAVASLDYIAGEWYESPRWDFVDALTKIELLQARTAVRAALGIRPDAPSQRVIDELTTAANRLESTSGDATAALSPAVFFAPSDEVMQRLANLPYIPIAADATRRAERALGRPGGNHPSFFSMLSLPG